MTERKSSVGPPSKPAPEAPSPQSDEYHVRLLTVCLSEDYEIVRITPVTETAPAPTPTKPKYNDGFVSNVRVL